MFPIHPSTTDTFGPFPQLKAGRVPLESEGKPHQVANGKPLAFERQGTMLRRRVPKRD